MQPETQILADDSEESAIDARIAELEKVGSSQVHTSHACSCHFFFAVKLMNLSVSVMLMIPKRITMLCLIRRSSAIGLFAVESCATMPTSCSPAVQSQMLATLPATLEEDDVLTTHEQSLLVLQQVRSCQSAPRGPVGRSYGSSRIL